MNCHQFYYFFFSSSSTWWPTARISSDNNIMYLLDNIVTFRKCFANIVRLSHQKRTRGLPVHTQRSTTRSLFLRPRASDLALFKCKYTHTHTHSQFNIYTGVGFSCTKSVTISKFVVTNGYESAVL